MSIDKNTLVDIKVINAKELPQSFFSFRRLSHKVDIVSEIIEQVKNRGDEAIRDYASKFDRANPSTFMIPSEQIKQAQVDLKKTNPKLYDALCFSCDMALQFAQKQRECFTDFEIELSQGIITGQKTIAVERAGVYVPAGKFPLLSSVIMGVTPAKAANVDEIILCSPPRQHPEQNNAKDNIVLPWVDEQILATASLCGVDKVFAIGGAQAIAAMAYGTQSIPCADVIVGAGNKFVAEAKRQVYGQVGIDLIAGPTEVMIIADDSAHADWLAADMLAQAEHDQDAQAILLTTSKVLAEDVIKQLKKQVQELSTKETAIKSLNDYAYIIVTESLEQAVYLANRKAPEHLELALSEGQDLAYLIAHVKNYGSLFIGHHTAEVLGDYSAGLNHTLPTSGSARFTGGLSVRHFLKTVTTLKSHTTQSKDNSGYIKALDSAYIMGQSEGLEAHAMAAYKRIDKK